MRKAACQLLFGFIVALLAACGGSPAPPTSLRAQAAPLSIYFSASDASLLTTMYALNASDGMVRWSQKESEYPVLGNGVIYASNYGRDNGVAAFAASDGRLLWFYRSTGTANITAVVNGVVYAAIYSLPSGYGSMYALDARNGTVLWHAEQPHVENGYAVVDDGVYAFMAKDAHSGLFGVVAFNAKTGGLLWKYQPDDGDPSFLQASNGQVYILVRSRDVATQVYLSALSASDGSVRWRYPKTGYADFKELGVGQGLVYLNSQADATLYALNASDGSIRWHVPKGGEVSFLQSLLTNDTLYVGLQDATLYALNASDGSTRWQARVGHAGGSLTITAPEVAADGVVYVSQFHDGLFALNASDGTLLWDHAEPQGAVSILAALNGMVYTYVGESVNTSTFYAFNASDGATRWSYQAGLLFNPVVG